MTIFVTGAGGFIGLNLVESLLKAGRTVVSFSPDPLQPQALARFEALPGALHVVKGDVLDLDHFQGALGEHGADTLVHLAAITAGPERELTAAPTIVAVNLVGLANALTAAKASGVKRFVYTGSIAAFGRDTPDGGLTEEDQAHDPSNLYGVTKSAAEAIVTRLAGLYDLDWVIGRIGRAFGPYEHETGVRDTMSQIYQVTQHARAGRAVRFVRPCVKNWNYAPDVGADLAMLTLAPSLPHRLYNLGGPYSWSLADWCAKLAERYPAFRYSVGENAAEGEPIDLLGARDGALLSWGRLEADFKRSPPHTFEAAFEDYLAFLDQTPDFGAR